MKRFILIASGLLVVVFSGVLLVRQQSDRSIVLSRLEWRDDSKQIPVSFTLTNRRSIPERVRIELIATRLSQGRDGGRATQIGRKLLEFDLQPNEARRIEDAVTVLLSTPGDLVITALPSYPR